MNGEQKKIGSYDKFRVTRRDYRDLPNGDRANADYFVLDLTYDKFALTALQAYAVACREEYPLLSEDLFRKIREHVNG